MGHPDVDFNPLLSLPPPEKEMKKKHDVTTRKS